MTLPSTASAADTPAKPSLTAVTAEGAAWTVVNMGLTRVLSVAAQLALTRLLMPEDLGLVGLAQFVVTFAAFIGTLSLTQFLIARQRRVRLYSGSAFWLTLLLGAAGGLLIAAAAPIAATLYQDRRLFGLLMFCAVTFPITAATVVPVAIAQIQLRFKLVAVMYSGSMLVQVLASVAAAWLGAGPYSVFIGAAAAALSRIIILAARLRLRFPWRPRHRFRAERVMLASTSFWLLGVGFFNNILLQGDYAVMGFFFEVGQIGYYFFAYNLAQQAVILFGTSLGTVLYPAIAALGEDGDRQRAALLRAVKMLMLVAVPGGLMITFLVSPIVHVFGPKYLPAVPIAQVMTVGALGLLVTGPALALISAQERFRFLFIFSLMLTGLFLSSVLLGCLAGRVIDVAVAVSIYSWVAGPLTLIVALDGHRVRMQTVWAVIGRIGPPTLGSVPGFAAALMVYHSAGSDGSFRADAVRGMVSALVFLAIVAPTLWLTMRDTCDALLLLARGVLRRLPGFGRIAAGPDAA